MILLKKKLRIGIDFDNTIVNYDNVFLYLGKKFNYLPKNYIGNKKEIRKYIIEKNSEKIWKKIQGLAYGKFIHMARPNYGVQNFLSRLNLLNISFFIVSHKTIYGHYDIKKINLRLEAVNWLKNNNFFTPSIIGLKKQNIYFRSTINKKIKKINDLNLDYFIDDLELILNHKNINDKINKILYNSYSNYKHIKSLYDWRSISHFILKKETKKEIKNWAEITLKKNINKISIMNGQKNSNIYLLRDLQNNEYILKYYPDKVFDARDRVLQEFSAFYLFKKNRINQTPNPIIYNQYLNIGIYDYIPGEKIIKINYKLINIALLFLNTLINLSKKNNSYPYKATESCTSIKELLNQIDNRTNNLLKLNFYDVKNKNLEIFLNKFIKVKSKLFNNIRKSYTPVEINYKLNKKSLILSPSDFGFHNSLLYENNLYFIDFEYFGWDDPVKLISDFFWHPAMNLNLKNKKFWLHSSLKFFENDKFNKRLKNCISLYGLRWILIILNDFIPAKQLSMKHKVNNRSSNYFYLNEQIKKANKICLEITNYSSIFKNL